MAWRKEGIRTCPDVHIRRLNSLLNYIDELRHSVSDGEDFTTGSAVISYYPAKTCAQMHDKDTPGGPFSNLFSDPCTLTWAEITADKAGYVGKTFAQACPVTCNAFPTL